MGTISIGPFDLLITRQVIVLASAIIYWGGVIVNASRIYMHIGKSPALKPKGKKERLLWTGWLFVITGWILQPIVIQKYKNLIVFYMPDVLSHSILLFIGVFFIAVGYAGTLWCYATLGDSWRVSVHNSEKTILVRHGPYRIIRHPIYLFQLIILAGAIILLPTLFSLTILIIHISCILTKAFDEEQHLMQIHGTEYKRYMSETGMFFPKIKKFITLTAF
jgi:protein-S-isoprenylcysteine O-methyltransferase Ste14